MPVFADFDEATDATIAACDGQISDTIGYQLPGGPVVQKKAVTDYGEALRDIESGKLIDNDISVVISKAQLSIKPSDRDRVTLPRTPGITWKPINARAVLSGTDWQFEVKRV